MQLKRKMLEEYLSSWQKLMPKDQPSLATYIYERGRFYDAAKLPKGVKRGKQGECFANAYRLARYNDELTYVEGYATSIIPVHHAWCVDKRGRVIDNTWDKPETCAYYGVAMDIDAVSAFIVRNKVYGVLGNGVNIEELEKLVKVPA